MYNIEKDPDILSCHCIVLNLFFFFLGMGLFAVSPPNTHTKSYFVLIYKKEPTYYDKNNQPHGEYVYF